MSLLSPGLEALEPWLLRKFSFRAFVHRINDRTFHNLALESDPN